MHIVKTKAIFPGKYLSPYSWDKYTNTNIGYRINGFSSMTMYSSSPNSNDSSKASESKESKKKNIFRRMLSAIKRFKVRIAEKIQSIRASITVDPLPLSLPSRPGFLGGKKKDDSGTITDLTKPKEIDGLTVVDPKSLKPEQNNSKVNGEKPKSYLDSLNEDSSKRTDDNDKASNSSKKKDNILKEEEEKDKNSGDESDDNVDDDSTSTSPVSKT